MFSNWWVHLFYFIISQLLKQFFCASR
jgi:hypothetical protein